VTIEGEKQAQTFEKRPTPDLRLVYLAERVEVVPYVTLLECEATEDKFAFEFGSERQFKTDSQIEQFRQPLIEFQTKGREFRDDPKARLVEVNSSWEGITLKFEGVRYSDYVITNNAMEIVVPDRNKTVREILEPGPVLTPLSESLSSNHLGLSCLVITKDHELILQNASGQKVTGAGQITSSASGAMDWQDGLPINPFEMMQAELYQELGLGQEHTFDILAIALGRELARGGKPEMFFVCKPQLSADEILALKASDPDKEVESLFKVDLPEDEFDLKEKLNKLISQDNISQSTKAAIFYLSRYL